MGKWIDQFLGLNSCRKTWEFPRSTPNEVLRAIVSVLGGLAADLWIRLLMPEFEIQAADTKRVHILMCTKLE